MNWGSLRARLGPIDDHELATFLGPDKSLSFWSIPYELFTNTEVGDLGNSSRFRWGFYLRRLVEISFFQDNAGSMYLIQTFIVGFSAFLVFMVIKSLQEFFNLDSPGNRFLGSISLYSIPISASIWFLATPSLTSGFMRIGVQEPTLVLGLLLTIFGTIQVVLGSSTLSKAPFFIIAAGATLASSSKENGYIVVLPLLLGFIYSRRVLRFRSICLPLIVSSVSILLVVYHNVRVLLRGSDQYGTTKSSGGMISSLIDRTNNHSFLLVLLCALLLSASHAKIKSSASKASLFVVLFCLILHLSESVFYGEDSVVTRYHAVSDISLILAVSITIQCVLINTSPSNFRTSPRNTIRFPAIALLLFVFLHPSQRFVQNREASYSLSESTIGYQKSIERLTTYLNEHPSNSLVIYLFDTADDGEPTYAIIQYLRMNGVKNQFYLSVREIDEVPSASLVSYRQISTDGDKKLTVEAWSNLDRSANDACFSATYNLANSEIPETDEVKQYCGYVG
jgi:hypothetical protein